MKLSGKILFIISAFIFVQNINGQGCSDAGICTIDNFKPGSTDSISENHNQVKLGFSYGRADHDIFVFGTYLEYNRKLSYRFGFDFKITSLSQNGNGISVFGPGDIFLNGNYKLNPIIGLTVGIKIPLSDGNKILDQQPLPMDYQSSLGTFDLIIGAGFYFGNFHFVAAWQQPLTQNNNTFLSSDYSEDNVLRGFQSTNNYKRSGDVLIRVSYPFNLGKKFKLTPGLLPIYHLNNDKYTSKENVEIEIIGSQGLTLNANIYLDYNINNKNHLQLNYGSPLIVRDARPDGLTRHFIVSLEYRFNF